MDQFSDMFKKVIEVQQARIAALAVAQVQAEHYKALEAAGIDPEVAIKLTARTSNAVTEMVSSVVESITKNAPALTEAFERISDRETVGPNS